MDTITALNLVVRVLVMLDNRLKKLETTPSTEVPTALQASLNSLVASVEAPVAAPTPSPTPSPAPTAPAIL